MKIARRKFLAGLGACVGGGAVGTMLSPLPWKVMDDVAIWTQNWPWTPVPEDGPSTYVSSVCMLCPGGCGISVRRIGNRAVKITGLETHPKGNGRVCPLGLSGLQYLYGPARVKSPLKRMGNRGEGKWQPISWDAAISELSQKLNDLRDQDRAHALAWISGEKNGTLAALVERFLKVYGSPNLLRDSSAQDAVDLAAYLTQGLPGTVFWDIEHADFILSFGVGLLDGGGTPALMSGFFNDAGGRTLIQIEPRLSDTAAKARQWIAVNPGTEGVLALGIAHVMIRESLYHTDFVNNSASGFEDGVIEGDRVLKGFKALVLDKYPPEKVSEITGVNADIIADIARQFARAGKSIAICGRGVGRVAGSLDEALAVHYLNALKGNIHQTGGVYVTAGPDYIRFPEPVLDQIAEKGIAQSRVDGGDSTKFPHTRCLLHRLPEKLLSAYGENPVEALLVSGANPLYTLSGTQNMKKAFDRIPFIVSFSPLLDETAAYADLVLPDHTYLEGYRDIVSSGPGMADAVVSLARPVVRPLYNTRHLGEVIIELAKAMGGYIEAAFPWENYESLLQETFADNWESLKSNGYIKIARQAPAAGGTPLNTHSKKFEFKFPADGRGDAAAPAFETIAMEGDPQKFPLAMIPYDTVRLSGRHMANPPFMTKTLDDTVLKKNHGFIEINPATARQLRLAEGDMVKLSTPRGEAEVKVHLYEGVMPGVIALPRGLGHTAFTEEWGLSGRGVNVNDLIGPVEDPASGLDMAWGIRAKLTKI